MHACVLARLGAGYGGGSHAGPAWIEVALPFKDQSRPHVAAALLEARPQLHRPSLSCARLPARCPLTLSALWQPACTLLTLPPPLKHLWCVRPVNAKRLAFACAAPHHCRALRLRTQTSPVALPRPTGLPSSPSTSLASSASGAPPSSLSDAAATAATSSAGGSSGAWDGSHVGVEGAGAMGGGAAVGADAGGGGGADGEAAAEASAAEELRALQVRADLCQWGMSGTWGHGALTLARKDSDREGCSSRHQPPFRGHLSAQSCSASQMDSRCDRSQGNSHSKHAHAAWSAHNQ